MDLSFCGPAGKWDLQSSLCQEVVREMGVCQAWLMQQTIWAEGYIVVTPQSIGPIDFS